MAIAAGIAILCYSLILFVTPFVFSESPGVG